LRRSTGPRSPARDRPTRRRTSGRGKRAAFVHEYAALRDEVVESGAKRCGVDAAHFDADAGRRGPWVLKGEPAVVDSTSPRGGEQASYDAAV
jgi:hypothetical protein